MLTFLLSVSNIGFGWLIIRLRHSKVLLLFAMMQKVKSVMLIGRSDRKNRFVSHLLVLRLLGLVPWHSCSFGSTNPKQARFVYTFNIGLMHNSSPPRFCIIPPSYMHISLSFGVGVGGVAIVRS